MKAKSMVTRTIGCPGIGLAPPMRSAINLRGSVLIIQFAVMTITSHGMWLWRGQPYILLAGSKPLPLTFHRATHREFQNDDHDTTN
jgi:hypothetical protein